ncbi:MAG: hypothetical protein ACFFCR_15340 [Promethearchaeota archaeon]
MCKTIKTKGGSPFKVLRKFKPYAPDLKEGEIVVICHACTESYLH